MTDPHHELRESLDFIRARVQLQPRIALVLGSGLGDFANSLTNRQIIVANEIPHYPHSTVEGHRGALAFGLIENRSVMAFQGRVHLYESGDPATVGYPLRVARALGAQVLIVTNAAGGINKHFLPGDLMLLTDQINFTGKTIPHESPVDRGIRFLYDPGLVETAWNVGSRLGLTLRRGVYAGVRGPSYETAGEVEMLRRLGADAVGMSTVLEVELAYSLQMKVLGLSCITNKATGVGAQKLSHDEVTVVANKVKKDFALLLNSVVAVI